jgi:hypothetical protein
MLLRRWRQGQLSPSPERSRQGWSANQQIEKKSPKAGAVQKTPLKSPVNSGQAIKSLAYDFFSTVNLATIPSADDG